MFNLENLNSDYFTTLNPQDVLDIKPLSTEEKIQCFKFFLTNDIITNVSVIANIFTLINGITNIDEKSNTDNRIFFNDLEEYVDIKLALKKELDEFNIRLVEYYIGIIEGLDVQLDELKIHIPNVHFNIFHLISPVLISKLMLKYFTKINIENVKPVHCADKLYMKINNPTSLMTDFLQSILSEVKENVKDF